MKNAAVQVVAASRLMLAYLQRQRRCGSPGPRSGTIVWLMTFYASAVKWMRERMRQVIQRLEAL